jgi:hypothetical protein
VTEPTVLERLSERFPAELVHKNPKGQDYVKIPDYINRLNTVLGTEWDFRVTSTNLERLEVKVRKKVNGEYKEVDATHYIAQVVGDLHVWIDGRETIRSGVGADYDYVGDPDKALKTAQAEALKKACHQFGICSYLWYEEERDLVQAQREAASGDISGLKKQVSKLFKELCPGATVNKEALKQFWPDYDLDSAEDLEKIVKDNM